MGELSEEEKALIQQTATETKRNAQDIQVLFTLLKEVETSAIKHASAIQNHTDLLKTIIDDKQSVFKWALGVIASLVVIGSATALGVSNLGP